MFYTNKDKAEVAVLRHEIEYLRVDIAKLIRKLDIQTIRVDGLSKAYPHGTTRTGAPRKKPGRKPKGTA